VQQACNSVQQGTPRSQAIKLRTRTSSRREFTFDALPANDLEQHVVWHAGAVARVPDPERETGRVDQVRYVEGAPKEWASWLGTGDTVSLVSFGIGIAVETPSGRGFLPFQSLQRIDLDDPIAAYQHRDNNVDWGKMTLGLMNMGALQALPRRPLGALTITVEDHVIAFDVSQRSWPDEALVTPGAERGLIRDGRSGVSIRDGSYRWISVKRFTVPDGASREAVDVLGALIGHPAYWDAYLGGDGISPHVHGPYLLEAISPDSFVGCDAAAVRTTLGDWLHRDGDVSDDQIEGSLSDVYQLIEDADTCLELPDLGEPGHNDYWFILDKPFIEFVLVGPGDRLALIVASGD
jgi:hypothetical protein